MIRDEKGKPDCIEGVIRDITERKEMEESLKESEEQIKTSLREKEVLLKEIHHRVKNNMQIISSLLNMQSESIEDEYILRIFKESQNRVKSMALVHEKLYQTKDLSRIDFGEYTRSLTSHLLRSFASSNTNRVQLVIDIDEVFLDVNKSIPCGLIVNEIVSNSFKHAFPGYTADVEKRIDGRKDLSRDKDIIRISMCENTIAKSPPGQPGKISVEADVHSRIIEMVISDNGLGFPDDIDFQNTKTMGLELVNILVSQIKGTIEHIKDKDGTEFKIIFRV
jgi:two-component sensor histidine kinase